MDERPRDEEREEELPAHETRPETDVAGGVDRVRGASGDAPSPEERPLPPNPDDQPGTDSDDIPPITRSG